MSIARQAFADPHELAGNVIEHVEAVRARDEQIDFLTFVPDGEPTLDENLGREIDLLRPLDIPVAVITNGSLINRKDVQQDLLRADLVSLSIDAITNDAWHRVDRPHGLLSLEKIRQGMIDFAGCFSGTLITETQLVTGVNETKSEISEISDFLKLLQPSKAYVAIPTRPPAESWVRPADEQTLNFAFQVFSDAIGHDRVEYLVGYEGNAFASTGDAEHDLLSITAVHPMRKDAVEALLERTGDGWETVTGLISRGYLVEIEYNENHYYMRRLKTSA